VSTYEPVQVAELTFPEIRISRELLENVPPPPLSPLAMLRTQIAATNAAAWRELMDRVTAAQERADCKRRRVGAVLVRDDGVTLGVGYNALPAGSCTAGACPRGRLSYDDQPAFVDYAASGCFSVHAEDRALQVARAAGHDVRGARLLVTATPCPGCERKLRAAGVTRWYVVELPSSQPAAPGAGHDGPAAEQTA
jgi:dCMP deaminase